ncbi:MAG: polymer-forming cytoskeletal protein [Planctomycetota bacterium]
MIPVRRNGSVLVVVLLILGLLSGLAVAYLLTMSSHQKTVDSSIEQSEYLATAQAGFDTAKSFLLGQYLSGGNAAWDAQLANSIANKTTYNETAPGIDVAPTAITTTFQWWRNIAYQTKTYVAEIANDNDGGGATNDTNNTLMLKVWAFGNPADISGRSGAVMLESLVKYKPAYYEPTSAVVVGGSLKVFGSAQIAGTDGNIQANGNVDIGGSATISKDVFATGNITGNLGNIGGAPYPDSGPVSIPSISPTQYAGLAGYILQSDGQVFNKSDSIAYAPPYRGWDYNGGLWSYNSGNSYDGTYYAQTGTDVKISGSPGAPATPWQVTIISEGYIDVSGNPTISPYSQNVALLAGRDLQMSGTASNPYTGLYAAHEQLKLSGTPKINGVVLAEDKEDLCNLVSTGSQFDISIAGNAEITYNGDMATFLNDGEPYIRVLGLKKTVR